VTRAGVFLLSLDGMLFHYRALLRIKLVGTHVYTWLTRGAVRVYSALPKYKMQRPQPGFTPGARFSKAPESFWAQKAIFS